MSQDDADDSENSQRPRQSQSQRLGGQVSMASDDSNHADGDSTEDQSSVGERDAREVLHPRQPVFRTTWQPSLVQTIRDGQDAGQGDNGLVPRGVPLRVDPHRGHPELGFISGVFADPRRPRHAVSIRRFMLTASGATDPRDAGISAALFALEMDGAAGSAGSVGEHSGQVGARSLRPGTDAAPLGRPVGHGVAGQSGEFGSPRERAYSAVSADESIPGVRSPSIETGSGGPRRWDEVGHGPASSPRADTGSPLPLPSKDGSSSFSVGLASYSRSNASSAQDSSN